MQDSDKIKLIKIFQMYNTIHIIKFIAEYLAERTAIMSKGITSTILENKVYVENNFKDEFNSQLQERV